jgi:hypothetical protein
VVVGQANGIDLDRAIAAQEKAGLALALLGVSCISAKTCMAVGTSINAVITNDTLTETSGNSGWSIVSSPNAAPADGSQLLGVSCVGNKLWCMAVGEHGTAYPATRQTLIELYQ